MEFGEKLYGRLILLKVRLGKGYLPICLMGWIGVAHVNEGYTALWWIF